MRHLYFRFSSILLLVISFQFAKALTDGGPVLSVTPTSVPLPYTGGMFTIVVRNTGDGTMNWSAQTTDSWFWIYDNSGINNDTIHVYYDVNRSAQRAGNITITATGATGSPATIQITQSAQPTGNFWQQTAGPTGGTITSMTRGPFGLMFATTYSSGVYRSLDTGHTWIYCGVPDSLLFDVEISPDRIYLGLQDNIEYSTDGGNNWIRKTGSPFPYYVKAIAVDSSGNVFAYCSQLSVGIYKSTDGGDTWVIVNTGLTNTQIQTLLAHPSGKIFAGTAQGIFVLDPNGTTWSSTGPTNFISQLSLAEDNKKIYAGTTSGFYVSSDTGKTWTTINSGLLSTSISSFGVASDGDIYTAISGESTAIQRLASGTSTWSSVNTVFPKQQVKCWLAGANGSIFAGTGGNGIFRSDDNGTTWYKTNTGLCATTIKALSIISDGSLLAGTDVGDIFRTTDHGNSWTQVYNGKPNNVTSVNSFSWISGGPVHCATSKGLMVSSDGSNWSWLPTTGMTTTSLSTVLVMEAISPNPAQIIVNGASGVCRSINGGINWNAWNTGWTSQNVYCLARNQAGDIYAGTDAGLYRWDATPGQWNKYSTGLSPSNIKVNGIFPSIGSNTLVGMDDGVYYTASSTLSSWTRGYMPADLHPMFYQTLSFTTTSDGSSVYAGVTYGACKSTDSGQNWSMQSDGLLYSSLKIQSIVTGSDGVLYAGSANGGVFSNYQSTLPVEITNLCAIAVHSRAELLWHTETEINNYGFNIERRMTSKTIVGWRFIGFVKGSGTSNSPHEYSFIDYGLPPGRYVYRIKQIDHDGSFKYYGNAEVEILAPSSFALEQNYPNPFNPTTVIRYQLPANSFVTLKIYDELGREVKILVNEQQTAGTNSVMFDASNIANGVYFYRLSAVPTAQRDLLPADGQDRPAGSFVQTKKLLLLK